MAVVIANVSLFKLIVSSGSVAVSFEWFPSYDITQAKFVIQLQNLLQK